MSKLINKISLIFLIIILIFPIFTKAQLPPNSSLYLNTVAPQPIAPSVPASRLDYSGWVQCDGVVDQNEAKRGNKCDFTNLIKMVNYLINWLFMISLPIIVGIIAYAGFELMTGRQDAIKHGKAMMWNALWGFVIMLTAWFMVSTVLSWILDPSFMDAATAIIGK